MYFPATTTRDRLLTAGIYIASIKGFARATLPESAAEARIPLKEAYSLFSSRAECERELLAFIENRMLTFESYDPTASGRMCRKLSAGNTCPARWSASTVDWGRSISEVKP